MLQVAYDNGPISQPHTSVLDGLVYVTPGSPTLTGGDLTTSENNDVHLVLQESLMLDSASLQPEDALMSASLQQPSLLPDQLQRREVNI